MTHGRANAPVVRMWRHIPKIVVLSVIALLVVAYYVTRPSSRAAPPRAEAPNVVYINQGVGSEKSPTRSP